MQLSPDFFSNAIKALAEPVKILKSNFFHQDTQQVIASIKGDGCLKHLQELANITRNVSDEYRVKIVPSGDKKYTENYAQLSRNLLLLEEKSLDFQRTIVEIRTGLKIQENIVQESKFAS